MSIKPIDIKDLHISKKYDLKLRSTSIVPSAIHGYSIAVEYMKRWFLKRFGDNYFNKDSILVEGSHVFDSTRKLDISKKMKRINPSVVITPAIDLGFNRDYLDSNLGGIDTFSRQSMYDGAFFQDRENNLFIQCRTEIIQLNFAFRIKVDTRPEQIDLYHFMKNAFKVGLSMGEDVDIDIHLPYSIMMQLAHDAHFEIDYENNRVVNVMGFLSYLNSHSRLPILYKLRCINGRHEFFLRVSNLYVYLKIPDQLSIDDGNRVNHLDRDFSIEMNVEFYMPVPQSYTYFSQTETTILDGPKINTNGETIGLYTLNLTEIPEMNKSNWNKYIQTEYVEENLNQPLEIDLTELLIDNFKRAIEFTKDSMLSPKIFIDIKLFNDAIEIPFDINWETNTVTTKINPTNMKTIIAIYIDTEYMNNIINLLNDQNKNQRINNTLDK